MIARIHVTDAHAKLVAGEKLHFLDVREPEEHAFCRIAGSQLIPLGDLATRAGEIEIEDGTQLIVYCHHGVRSLSGAAILHNAGIEAMSLHGGIEAWSLLVDPNVPRY